MQQHNTVMKRNVFFTGRQAKLRHYENTTHVIDLHYAYMSSVLSEHRNSNTTKKKLMDEQIIGLGLDRYRSGIRYPILSAAAVLIPILEMTSPIAWGKRILHMLHIPYVRFKT